MKKYILTKIRKHRIIILIALAIALIILVILGFTMNPDEIWKPSTDEQTTQSR